jgi:hypothetical protein
MAVNFKTLFEVKLLHQYFLTGQDGVVVFEKPDQDSRLSYLAEEFALNKESINEYIDFRFPETLRDLYQGYNLKLIPTYSGCKVAVRVEKITQADQSIVYRPLTSIGDVDIFILIINKSGGPGRFSSGNLGNALPAAYFFSNEEGITSKTHPFITSNVPPVELLHEYEQGELASFGAGDIREFYKTAGGDQWVSVKATALANEADRILLPTQFDYFIPAAKNVRQGVWILKDNNGSIIKTLSIDKPEPLSRTRLDFSAHSDSISVKQQLLLPDDIYTLEFTGDTGFSQTHRVVFSDALYDRSNWGIIHIKINPSGIPFRLIEIDGFIVKRKTPVDDIPHPVFEIPVKSRTAFWRYLNDRDKELKLILELEDFLDKDNKALVTKRPRSIARDYFLLQNDFNNLKKYLPNPETYMLSNHGGRICFDIRVPESTLFPTV